MKGVLQQVSKRVSQSLSSQLRLTPVAPFTSELIFTPVNQSSSPCWAFTQLRGVKVSAIDVRPGNVIEKSGHLILLYRLVLNINHVMLLTDKTRAWANSGRMYEVVDAGHRQRGRGGAMMQMELRDVDSGNKLSLRFGPEDSVEKIFVTEKSFMCLYTEQDHVFLIEPDTFEQIEVSLELFGKTAAYLKAEMKVRLQLFDGRPLSASVPKYVTCIIKETQVNSKGTTVNPRYRDKRALLDNGLIVQVPPYLEAGEEILINTQDDSFLRRDNK